jgi:predicted nucleic acid-binding protein
MSKTIVIDASVAAAFLIPQDFHHTVARRWFDDVFRGEDRLIAPTLILLEVASAMTRVGMGEKTIDVALDFLREACELFPSFELEFDSISLIRLLRLRAMDAYYVALAKLNHASIHTFDNAQRNAAKQVSLQVLDVN